MLKSTTGDQIKVLVVDDSAFMRKALTMMLEEDPQIKVVGTARDGEDGIFKARNLKPDLITMDIEMPRMDGLTALRQIMSDNPTPVMMVSSLTTDGADATLEALELGAVDFISKELSYVSLDIVKIKDELQKKIKNIASRKNILMSRYRNRMVRETIRGSRITPTASTGIGLKKRYKLIIIGSSTGGPQALQDIIPLLPPRLNVPVLVAQHMPPMFTKSLAERLDRISRVRVKEAEPAEMAQPGVVYIAPGGKQLTVKKENHQYRLHISTFPKDALYKPSVDILMASANQQAGGKVLGVMLTGMGQDGLSAFQALKKAGGMILAQNEATSIVYGMPKAVVEAGIADHILPVEEISNQIASYF